MSKISNKEDKGGGNYVDKMFRISLTDWQILTRTIECEVSPDYMFIDSFEHYMHKAVHKFYIHA